MTNLVFSKLRHLLRNEDGQVAFFFVVGSIAFLILSALAWDAGVWYFDHRTAQNQVDAAALAAIQELPSNDTSGALAVVIDWLKRNGVDDAVADAIDVVHQDDSLLSPECLEPELEPSAARVVFGKSSAVPLGEYDMVRVCVRRDSLVLFAGLAGVTDAVVSAGGTAAVEFTVLPYALMAMDPNACESLDVAGSGGGIGEVILLDEGASYTASTCSNALTVRGTNSHFQGAFHDVCGGNGGNGLLETAPPNFGVCSLPDPWSGVAPPPQAADPCSGNLSFSNGSHILSPGVYCSLSISGNGTLVTLEPGIYVFKGDPGTGVSLTGNGTGLSATGETLIFMTCSAYPCAGASPGAFSVTGNCNTNPCPVEPKLVLTGHSGYENIGIYVDRTAGPFDYSCITVAGEGNVKIDGNLYALGCRIRMAGQGGAIFELNGTIVGATLDFEGQAQYFVTWNADFAPKIQSYALVD